MINNIHQDTLAAIQEQLPKEAVILEAISNDENSSTLKVDYNGYITNLKLEKEDLTNIFNTNMGVVVVKRNTTNGAAILKFLTEAKVNLLPGKDYDINNLPDTNGVEFLDIVAMSNSITVKGKYTIRVVVEDDCLEVTDVNCPGCELKAKLLLNSYILENVEGDLFDGDKLSTKAIDTILNIFSEKDYKVKPTYELLSSLVVGEIGEDNISKILVFETEDMGTLTIRFNDKPKFIIGLPEEREVELPNGQTMKIKPGEAMLEAPDYTSPDNPEMFSPGPPPSGWDKQ